MDDPRTRHDAASPAPYPLHLVLHTTSAAVVLDRSGLVLGRHSQADIRLPLPDVSRRHCRFDFANGSWHVTDLASLNGIFVNDRKVDSSPLGHRDRLRVGGFTFEVHVGHDIPTLILPRAAVAANDTLLAIAGALPYPHDPAEPLRRAS